MLEDPGLRESGIALQIQFQQAGTDIRAADIDGKRCIVALENPSRREMRSAKQPGMVGVVAYRSDFHLDLLGLENDRRAANGKFADAAPGHASAHHQPLGLLPSLQLEKTLRDSGKLLREAFDRAVDDAGCFGVTRFQELVEALLVDVVAGLITEGVLAEIAKRLAPGLDEFAKGLLAGAVADETVLILQLDVVAVDFHRR